MSLYNFYRSKEWVNLLQYLKMSRLDSDRELLCEYCYRPIVRKYDCIGHHEIPLTEENYTDASISLNPDNIKLVHHRCHNLIHNKLSYSGKQVYIVHGSPFSGKSSYVDEVREDGDLVLDMDNIWQAVSGCKRYVKPARLNAVVFSIRDNILESIRYRRGKWLNAYVIGGYPYQAERERLADTLGARLIHIDTDKNTCVNRCYASDDRNHNEWLQYINEYWEKYDGGY